MRRGDLEPGCTPADDLCQWAETGKPRRAGKDQQMCSSGWHMENLQTAHCKWHARRIWPLSMAAGRTEGLTGDVER